jgi:cation transport regulator
MPYDRNADLPKQVTNNLPQGGQTIYRKAFNSAEDQYDEEERAHKVAWSAVKKKYEKSNGEWKRKD